MCPKVYPTGGVNNFGSTFFKVGLVVNKHTHPYILERVIGSAPTLFYVGSVVPFY
jgi:hypothetical protein